jgi:esterase/lipase superfamily enzyme
MSSRYSMRLLSSLIACFFLFACVNQQKPTAEKFSKRVAARHHRDHVAVRPPLRKLHSARNQPNLSPPPAPTGGTNDDIKALQPVLFATNRMVADGTAIQLDFITSDRSTQTTFGRVVVSVPKDHLIGNVERPKFIWYELSMEKESDSKHFRIKQLSRIQRDEFISEVKSDAKSAMVFIHGYNVSFMDAVFKAAQIAYDANFPGAVVTFSWPSRANLASYDYDRESAESSSDALFDLLKLIKEDAKIDKIYVIAHSLGSWIAVDALRRAALSNTPLNISELIFAAPDVDRDVFASRAAEIESIAERVTLYASSVDRALMASGVKAGSVSRIGYVFKGGPVLVDGVETIDVTAVGDDMFGLNHSTFSGSRSVLDDIGRIITAGIHPPNVRSPTLRGMPNKRAPSYWMYPP